MVRQPAGNGFVNAGARAAALRITATGRALSSRMRKSLILLILCVASNLLAQTPQPTDDKNNRANLTIVLEALGDNSDGVVCRTTFRYTITSDVPPEIPLVLQGSIIQSGIVVKRFRYPLLPGQRDTLTAIHTLQPVDAIVEARLMIPLEEEAPVIVGKTEKTFPVVKTGKPYIANEAEGAESIVAEGSVPETTGAVKILTPRRDIAPQLFVVEVDVRPPVKKVEFWVEGK